MDGGFDWYVTSRRMDYELTPPRESRSEAAEWWANVKPYTCKADHPKRIARIVSEYQPSSVLEFGSSAGRNLRVVRQLIPGCRIIGIDINADAVHLGRERYNLDLRVGDEAAIRDFPVDVAFTVSVLDHLPDPQPALESLVATATKAVVLWEPWMGEEGRIARHVNQKGEWVDATPYSYSWDYEKRTAHLPVKIESEPAPIKSRAGSWYRIYRITPQRWGRRRFSSK